MLNAIADHTFAVFDNAANKKLWEEIEKRGAKIFRFPVIEPAKPQSAEASASVIRNLDQFDWIIFTDVLAVDFFLQYLEENGVDFFELDERRVCALGEAVADRLRFAQLHADVIPNRIDAAEVASALKIYTGDSEFDRLKFLVVKESLLAGDIRNELAQTKAEITELPVYQIKFAVPDEIVKLKTLLKGGAIDEFILSAPTDFIALQHIFGEEPLPALFAEIKVSAVDGAALQSIREHGLVSADLFRLEKIDTVLQ